MIYIHDAAGRITCQTNAPPEEVALMLAPGQGFVEDAALVSGATHYVLGGALVPFPPKPSAGHEWDWNTHAFVLSAEAVARLRAARKLEVSALTDAALDRPIAYGGALFDADSAARENVNGVLDRINRGDGLPAGWVGWRSADNRMLWASATAEQVLVHLQALARLLEDRKQAILVVRWTHNDALDGMMAADEITAYDVTTGWPA